MINVNVGWAHRNWEVDGFARFQSAREGLQPLASTVGTMLVPLAGYVAIDGRVAYRLSKKWTFAASGQNIAHAQQRQTAGAEVERQLMGSVAFDF